MHSIEIVSSLDFSWIKSRILFQISPKSALLLKWLFKFAQSRLPSTTKYPNIVSHSAMSAKYKIAMLYGRENFEWNFIEERMGEEKENKSFQKCLQKTNPILQYEENIKKHQNQIKSLKKWWKCKCRDDTFENLRTSIYQRWKRNRNKFFEKKNNNMNHCSADRRNQKKIQFLGNFH